MTDVASDIGAGEAVVGATGAVDDGLVAELVARAQAGGVKLTGEGGLLQQLTKRVVESALEGELTDHLGHEPGERAEGGRENYRNGHRSKTVIIESGPVEIAVPRDRAGSFEPQLVKKRQRPLGGVDEMVLSLSAKGLTHGESRIRKAVRARGHFPTDQAALKCVYLAVMSLDPTGTGCKRWTMPGRPRSKKRIWHEPPPKSRGSAGLPVASYL